MSAYLFDVFISYPRGGNVEPWVRRAFVPEFRRAMHEELARSDLYVDDQNPTGTDWPDHLKHALLHSRTLVAVFSAQYFQKDVCRAEIDSMLLRSDRFAAEGEVPRIPVHAIVVHDCQAGVPDEYGRIQRADFKQHAVGVYTPSKAFLRAIAELAEDVAETVRRAPDWSPDFPLAEMIERMSPGPMTRPRM